MAAQVIPASNTIKILGVPGCSWDYKLRDFLHRSDVPFEWIQISSDEQVRAQTGANVTKSSLPMCVFPDGTRLERPTIRQLTEKLGWFHNPSLEEYDLAIYGAGPAGLSAAVYGSSEGLKTVLIERWAIGGQAGSSSKIENYLGFPDGISGAEMADRARRQANRFGTDILVAREGVKGEFPAGKGVGTLADGTKIIARATICATGIEYARLGLPNEDTFIGTGLYYGAGASEAEFCKDQHVFVIGGGNSAGQAAMHFAPVAKQVTMVIRGDSLKATLSQYLVDRIHATPNIEVFNQTEVTGLSGDNHSLDEITLTNRKTGESKQVKTKFLFVCIGGAPNTQWAGDLGVVRDDSGYLVTGPDLMPGGKKPSSWPLDRDPYYLETSMPGLFAAGDVRHGSVKRCASAVGEGAMAVSLIHRYLASG